MRGIHEGTIRGALAVLITLTVCLAVGWLTWQTGQIAEGIWGLAGTAIGYFFGSKEKK